MGMGVTITTDAMNETLLWGALYRAMKLLVLCFVGVYLYLFWLTFLMTVDWGRGGGLWEMPRLLLYTGIGGSSLLLDLPVLRTYAQAA